MDGLAEHLDTRPHLAWISDDQMRANLARSSAYTVVVLLPTEKLIRPQVDPIIWAHGRGNMALMAAGIAPIISPVTAAAGPSGFAIFTTDPDETRAIRNADPGVLAGLFIYEIHPARGFPGTILP